LFLLSWVYTPNPSQAQGTARSQQGDPPIAALISISRPNAQGVVTINGSVGAVFPSAQVAIRNLYTEQTVYTTAGITGSFQAALYGPGSTPFWISASTNIPPNLRDRPGSLPGGPGTIIYGSAGETIDNTITEILIDGNLNDWQAYPQSRHEDNYALRNANSVYLALQDDLFAGEYAQVRLRFLVDSATYIVTVARDQLRQMSVRQTTPTPRDRGEFAGNLAFNGDILEIRIPINFVDSEIAQLTLVNLTFLDAANTTLQSLDLEAPILPVSESDGVLYPSPRLENDATPFYIAGPVAQGASYWFAQGRVSTLSPAAGERLILEMDVSLIAPDLPLTTSDLTLRGQLGLQPVGVSATLANNGWSSLLTPSGLAIDNLNGDVYLGETATEWLYVTRRSDRLVFGLRFEVTLPAELPEGIYIPTFSGSVETADGQIRLWSDNGLFGTGNGVSEFLLTRLPIPLNIGGVMDTRLYWTLFHNHPSDGSRGMLPEEDLGRVALSNRVKWNAETYILPPGQYPIEPYIPNLLANHYQLTTAPLIPFLLPGGRLTVQITRPDGTLDDLGGIAIVQNQLSSVEIDERDRFGAQSPIDLFRLTTLSENLKAYRFDQYGPYTIRVTGTIEDTYGNRYSGGGTYRLMIAEPLDLQSGVLTGTPFEVGDVFYPGLHVLPGLPVSVVVRLQIYPLDGRAPISYEINGTANRYGYFVPSQEDPWQFEVSGEYLIDYNARFTGEDGRLWAASLRGAGVIGQPETPLIARGQRGLDSYDPVNEARPAWFNTREYPTDVPEIVNPQLLYPYHQGDIAVYQDSPESGIRPILQIQDLAGAYSTWLQGTLPNYRSPIGLTITEAAQQDALPILMVLGGPESPIQPALLPDLIVNKAYAYVSAVRPGASVRQFVLGGDDTLLPTYWDGDDPLNGQIGAGIDGDRLGDYVFLFGGAIVRNPEAAIEEATIYAALGLAGVREGDLLGARVYPPHNGASGGPNSGPLLVLEDQPYDLFFHPTGVQPGQVMQIGESFAFAGQAAPTLPTRIRVTITAPSGEIRQFDGITNTIGYFYDPAQDFTVNEVGLWTVEVITTAFGTNSAGVLEAPFPVGTVPGAEENRFVVYVTRPNTPSLVWNRGNDIEANTPAAGLFNFTINIPTGLTEVQSYQTVTMPGYILDSGRLNTTSTAGYQYNPPELARQFPNLEPEGRGSTSAASDVVTITFVVIGTDAQGERQLYTRTFTILHNRIISLEG
jgi:hypothetical protein